MHKDPQAMAVDETFQGQEPGCGALALCGIIIHQSGRASNAVARKCGEFSLGIVENSLLV
jgi:hypothetical protein